MPDEDVAVELVSSDALAAIERSQIDMQVATAKRFPRSIDVFMKEAKGMIALNQETAEGCNYKLKRKNPDGSMKIIEGPSIRLMEIAASAYTNLKFGSRIIGIDQEFVTAQGVAIDMQRNIAVTVEVKRSIKGKHGRYGTDMIMVTANAAGSIARRNALLGGAIPRAYVQQLSDHAKAIALGEAKPLPERLQRAFEYFVNTLGVPLPKVLEYLEKPSVVDCGLAELEVLQGLKTAIKEGDTTVEAEFPADKPKEETPSIGGKPATPAAAAPTPPAPPSERKPRAKKEAPPAEAAPAPTPPAAASEPPSPKPEETKPEPPAEQPPAPPAPEFTPADLATMVAEKLQESGVSVDDFFDWLNSTGRNRTFQFDLEKVGSIPELPVKLLQSLTADGYENLKPCIRIFGAKKG